MEVDTLRCITTEICGRKADPFLESCLPKYISEVTGLLKQVRHISRDFPLDLEPAGVFSFKPVRCRKI